MEHEIVSTPLDKSIRLPRNSHRRGGAPARAPACWNTAEVLQITDGQFQKNFLNWCCRALGVQDAEILHVCSGALPPATPGIRVDVRKEMIPDIVADGRYLPFPDGSFKGILIDPPYSVEYARTLYGTDYPRPSHLLGEASRVLVPGGRVAIIHFLIPSPAIDLDFVRVWGISTGLGYRIRALTLFQKRQKKLPFVAFE